MPNMTRRCKGAQLFVKRDDAMGMAFGGNKVRQLEFYLGAARERPPPSDLTGSACFRSSIRSRKSE